MGTVCTLDKKGLNITTIIKVWYFQLSCNRRHKDVPRSTQLYFYLLKNNRGNTKMDTDKGRKNLSE